MKQSISSLGAFGLLSSLALAGSVAPGIAAPAPVASSDGFAQARRPISNPTFFDLALPTTNIHPIFHRRHQGWIRGNAPGCHAQ